MKISFQIKLPAAQKENRGQKTGPHIEKIESVEAVGDDQKETGQGIYMGIAL